MTHDTGRPILHLSIEPRPTTLPLPGGRELPFADAALVLRNVGDEVARSAVLKLTIRQDTTVLVEGSDALMAGLPAAGLAPGAAAEWGLYAVLQAVDLGFAGKIHLFGPKAALNWPFHVEVTVSDALSEEEGSPTALRSTVRWRSLGAEAAGIEVELGG